MLNRVKRVARNLLDQAVYRQQRQQVQTVQARQDSDYQSYIDTQLQRTMAQRHRHNSLRSPHLIDSIMDHVTPAPGQKVLCIGCRDTNELDYFRSKGMSHVTGIDLFSNSPDVQVMDMHNMTFPDDEFDVIYSSHSLEHAYDPAQVIAEIVRIARPGALVGIEVPIGFQPRGADIVDFGTVSALHDRFGTAVNNVLLSEEHPPNSANNPNGNRIARVVFQFKGEDSGHE